MNSAATLDAIAAAFEGVFPSTIATCSMDGVPNIIFVSQVYRVDEERIAISDQFLRRTRENLAACPRAQAYVVDPLGGGQYRLDLAYERREVEGPVVARMRAKLEGIAHATGMASVFALRGALLCRVLDVRRVPIEGKGAGPERAWRPPGLAALGRLAQRLEATSDLGALSGPLLEGLSEVLGYRHSMLLVADGPERALVTIDSRGFPASGVGSEVVAADGPLGQCAARKTAVRLSSISRDRIYARAAAAPESTREIPLPGLPDAESLLAVPLLVGNEVAGVLAVESREAAAFGPDDELALSVIGHIAARAIHASRHDGGEDAGVPLRGAAPAVRRTLAVRYYEADDSIFFDGNYLIRGVAGRILWTVLSEHVEAGRADFTNRELRRDRRLQLAGYNDNLEARLLLLRRRLDEKEPALRLVPTGRGRFRVERDRDVTLELEKAR